VLSSLFIVLDEGLKCGLADGCLFLFMPDMEWVGLEWVALAVLDAAVPVKETWL
jgi:hypothetical protein